jgi:hypothetical protein
VTGRVLKFPQRPRYNAADNNQSYYAAMVGALREAPCLFDPPARWMKGEMWFRVTTPEGKYHWLQSTACTRVRYPVALEQKAQPKIKCVIDVGGMFEPVLEDMDMIMKVLRKNE